MELQPLEVQEHIVLLLRPLPQSVLDRAVVVVGLLVSAQPVVAV
jgi:hypothetical protein